jgi:hypothetical protein
VRASPDLLASQLDQLRAELELARSGDFYLRLDVGTRSLELLLGGVVLERYPVLAVDRGTPRVAFWPRAIAPDWDRIGYSAGTLEPPRERDRLEVVADAGSPTALPQPRTAEESVSVPARWRVRFGERLSLEVGSPGGARHRGLLRRIADAASHWHSDQRRVTSSEAGVWLRVQLAAEDSAALYRTLPPDVGLVVRSAAPD